MREAHTLRVMLNGHEFSYRKFTAVEREELRPFAMIFYAKTTVLTNHQLAQMARWFAVAAEIDFMRELVPALVVGGDEENGPLFRALDCREMARAVMMAAGFRNLDDLSRGVGTA